MIDFWASWCRPCRMENPNVVKLYHKYHDKGFEIYSVSLDKNRADWVRAIEQDGLVWPNHVSDLNGWTSSGGATYGIMSVPSTVLVDRDGKIIARNLRGYDLANKLKEIFGE
jgi:thiol-disulfide isomerase/thioredoxin